MRRNSSTFSTCFAIAILSLSIIGGGWARAEETKRKELRRKGAVMGLDPGVVLRWQDGNEQVWVRMNLRIGGCITPRIQIGADWRMEIFAGGEGSNGLNRHEIGPVATFFLARGWFARTWAYLGNFQPFMVTAGLGTGYEWGLGRFTAMGVSVGGDVNILFNGEPPPGYAFFVAWYLSAYDLGSRHGRED